MVLHLPWVRPLVPNVEAIPEQERTNCQNYLWATPHNPNNIDLSRDVRFQLAKIEDCRKVEDTLARLEALICWIENQRSVAIG